METQVSIAHSTPFPLYIPCMAILILPLFLLLRFFYIHNAQTEVKRALLLGISLCWISTCGIFLILFGRGIPAADSASVYSIAEALALGHTEVIHPTESYLSYYPQQIGLIAFYEIILRIWNLFGISYSASYIIQCVNVGMACLMVCFQYNTVRLLSNDSDSAAVSYIYLAMLNAPLIVYTSFVYGEIPSFSLLSGGLWLLLKYLSSAHTDRRADRIAMAGCLLMLTAGVALRKNSLIIIIAAFLVMLWEWLTSRRRRLLLLSFLLLLCSVAVLPAIQHIYEQRAGNTLSSGVPAISYVAMGMQESSRGNGWYNGFNFNAYQESHLDTAVTAEKSREAISASLSAFRAGPGYLRSYKCPQGYCGIHIFRQTVRALYSLLLHLSTVSLRMLFLLFIETMALPQIRRPRCRTALLYRGYRCVGRLFVSHGLGGQFPLYSALFSAPAALCGLGIGHGNITLSYSAG